ncbi:MAG: hypothetical protein JNN20_16290, partial [Betaproteobacteria bacterium]|nr:hypothetical protein [Betaproteobacteria bacterium]
GDALIKRQKKAAEVRSLNEARLDPAARPSWQFGSIFSYRHLLQRRLDDQGDVKRHEKLLSFTFGPGTHWSTLIWTTNIWAVLLVVAPFFVPLFSTRLNKADMAAAWMLMLPIFFVSLRKGINHSIYQTRQEQKLLSLTPAWLPDRSLKRWFATFAFRYSMICLVSCISIILLASWVHGIPLSSYEQPLLTVIVCAVFLFGTSLRSYSTSQKPVFADDLVSLAVGLGPFLLLQFAKIFKYSVADAAILAIASGIAFSVWRWYKFTKGTLVLPAGVLAKP